MKPFSFLGYSLLILSSVSSDQNVSSNSTQLCIYCGSLDNYTCAEIENPQPLLINTCFDAALTSMFYIFGYNTTPQDEITEVVMQAIIDVKTLNGFLYDWSLLNQPGDTVLEYVVDYPTKAIPNAIKVGKALAKALDILSNSTLDLKKTHVMGHSLGAHVAGYCGTELQRNYNKIIARITGMDPAGPGYEILGFYGLTPTCATDVEAYHTNPGVFGNARELAQRDIWFNCQNKYQPKCKDVELTKKDSCSHLSINYYVAEILRNHTAFVAAPSSSCLQWAAQGNTTGPLFYLGDYTEPLYHGNAYLRTNAESPYGMGIVGAEAASST